MKYDGNSLMGLAQKLHFFLIPTSTGRTNYILKHKDMFHNVGNDFFFQPRKFPQDPELISFGNNVKVSAGVVFINHDITYKMLNCQFDYIFEQSRGCIKIGDNVMLGANVILLPNIQIGSNVIIGAGSIVTRDIPDNTIAAGVPCKPVGNYDEFVNKRKHVKKYKVIHKYWEIFEQNR